MFLALEGHGPNIKKQKKHMSNNQDENLNEHKCISIHPFFLKTRKGLVVFYIDPGKKFFHFRTHLLMFFIASRWKRTTPSILDYKSF
jgi:hypothetical protein